MIAELATDFAAKRKALLAAHVADYKSAECHSAYDASEDALERLQDAMQTELLTLVK